MAINISTDNVSESLAQLLAQYNASQPYKGRTPEEIRQQAQFETRSYYDQLRLAAQQQHATSDLALQQQRAGLAELYNRQREQSKKQYDVAYNSAENRMLSHGMQRSSYGAQTLANIRVSGAEAQGEIGRLQTAAEGDVDARRVQLAQQLAQQLMQYGANQTNDELKRMRELEDQDYQRQQESDKTQNALATQIYNLMYQQQRDREEDRRWQLQYDQSMAGGGGGGRSGGGRSGGGRRSSGGSAAGGLADESGRSLGDLMSALSGGRLNSLRTDKNINNDAAKRKKEQDKANMANRRRRGGGLGSTSQSLN